MPRLHSNLHFLGGGLCQAPIQHLDPGTHPLEMRMGAGLIQLYHVAPRTPQLPFPRVSSQPCLHKSSLHTFSPHLKVYKDLRVQSVVCHLSTNILARGGVARDDRIEIATKASKFDGRFSFLHSTPGPVLVDSHRIISLLLT